MSGQPLRVLVVDDEPLAREYLRSIPLGNAGYQIIGEAANGKQALALCRKYLPEIVLLDIGIPLTDGVTVAETIHKEFPLIQVIMLTCHDELHYAQRAMRVGAVDYVLKKDLDPETLLETLNKTRERVLAARHSKAASEEILNRAARCTREACQHVVRDILLHPADDCEPVDEKLSSHGLVAPFTLVSARSCIRSTTFDQVFAAQADGTVDLFHETLGTGFTVLTVSVRPGEWVFIIQSGPDRSRLRMENTAYSIGDLLLAAAQTDDTLGPNIGISDVHDSLSEMPMAYQEAVKALDVGFYEGPGRYSYRMVNQPGKVDHTGWGRVRIEILTELEHSPETAATLFANWCQDKLRKVRPEPNEVRRLALELLARLNLTLEHVSSEIVAIQLQESQRDWLTILTGSRFLVEVQLVVDCWLRQVGLTLSKGPIRDEITAAVKHITGHLGERLSPDDLATLVKLSPSRFRTVFRTAMGEGVLEFINRMRIQQAKRLLDEGQLSVMDVANMVGIPNYPYFWKVFRQYTGVSPTEYRASLNGQVV